MLRLHERAAIATWGDQLIKVFNENNSI